MCCTQSNVDMRTVTVPFEDAARLISSHLISQRLYHRFERTVIDSFFPIGMPICNVEGVSSAREKKLSHSFIQGSRLERHDFKWQAKSQAKSQEEAMEIFSMGTDRGLIGR